MNTDTAPKYFRQEVINSFCSAFNDAADRLWEIMQNQMKRNQAKEEGRCATQETVKPSIKIELNERGCLKIHTGFECLEKYRDKFVDEREYDPDQPELNLQQGNAGTDETAAKPVTHDAFYNAVLNHEDGVAVSEDELDDYFGSMKTGDFEGWYSAGNQAEAAAIVNDTGKCAAFIQLVKETIDAGTEIEE